LGIGWEFYGSGHELSSVCFFSKNPMENHILVVLVYIEKYHIMLITSKIEAATEVVKLILSISSFLLVLISDTQYELI